MVNVRLHLNHWQITVNTICLKVERTLLYMLECTYLSPVHGDQFSVLHHTAYFEMLVRLKLITLLKGLINYLNVQDQL